LAALRGANCLIEGKGVLVRVSGPRGAEILRSPRAFRNRFPKGALSLC
jgi:hypothetical protein